MLDEHGLVRVMLILLCMVASASGSPIELADIVGAYHGKLAWSGCLAKEGASATVVIGAVDGAMEIDASSVRPQLHAVALVVSERGLVGRQAAASIELAVATAGSIELAIVLDSGCRAHARMHRASSGIRDCGRLPALARVAAEGSPLPSRPRGADPDTARPARRRTAIRHGAIRRIRPSSARPPRKS